MKKRRKKILIIGTAALATCILLLLLGKEVIAPGTYTITLGEFESTVLSKGEMKSQKYRKINLPELMQDVDLGIYHLKINDLVEEGTIVKKGDYVATLDQEQIKSELSRNMERLENFENTYKISIIDSTTSLTNRRNNIEELTYDLEYKELEMKQSIYESLSYQNKMKRNYERAVRQLEVAMRNYQREQLKYTSRCTHNQRNLKETEERVKKLQAALKASLIRAPADGMIIYATTRRRKRKSGDYVSLWSPEIAVLPDLSQLVSEGYIEEIHIAKVGIGSKVRVRVDALPDKVFSGEVISISNIGKTVSGIDSKVFDIGIRINESDENIAHGMTTSNEIITHYEKEALIVPLNYVFVDNNGTFVYLKTPEGFQKQYISISHSNDEMGLISAGLKAGDVVYTKEIKSE